MTSEPITTATPGARVRPPAHRTARSVARTSPVWSMTPDRAARGVARSWPVPRPRSRRCGCGYWPRPNAPEPVPSGPQPRRRTGSRSRPDRPGSRPARTSSSPPPSRPPHRVRAALESGACNLAQARVIVTALDRLPASGEFAVERRPAAGGRAAPGRPREASRREGAGGVGAAAVRGDRPGPGRRLRRQSAGRAGSHRRPPGDVHAPRGRRRQLPRPVPDPDPARPMAEQDDPRPRLTDPVHTQRPTWTRSPCPPRSATATRCAS